MPASNWNPPADGLLFGFLVGSSEIVMMSLELFYYFCDFTNTKKNFKLLL